MYRLGASRRPPASGDVWPKEEPSGVAPSTGAHYANSSFKWWEDGETETASHRAQPDAPDISETEKLRLEIYHDPSKELESIREGMPNAPGTTAMLLGPGGLRGRCGLTPEEDDRSTTTASSDESGEDQYTRERRRARLEALHRMRENVHGIYEGKRTMSPSPCPAPYVAAVSQPPAEQHDFDDRWRKQSQSRKLLLPTAKLYLAFKRADVAGDDWPSTSDIRRTFLSDTVVQNIFGLTKEIPGKRSAATTGTGATEDAGRPSVEAPSTGYPVRQFAHNSSTESICSSTDQSEQRSRYLFGQRGYIPQAKRGRKGDGLWWTYMADITSSWWSTVCEKKNKLCTDNEGFAYPRPKKEPGRPWPPAPQEETYTQQCCRLTRGFVASVKRHTALSSRDSDGDWTPDAKAKVAAMLDRLRALETDATICVSQRRKDIVTIGFPKYAETFGPFLQQKDWAVEAPLKSSEPEPRCFAQHRLLGPSIGNRLVRDGYLGTDLSQYEITLPGRLAHPRTLRMEGPSCALAPRNRGGLPRQPLVPPSTETIEVGQEESKLREVRESEAHTNALLRDTMTCLLRYYNESTALRQKVAQANNYRFLEKSLPVPPPPITDPSKVEPKTLDSDHLFVAPSPLMASEEEEEDLLLTGPKSVSQLSQNDLVPRTESRFDETVGPSEFQPPQYSEYWSESPAYDAVSPTPRSSSSDGKISTPFNWNPTPALPTPVSPTSPPRRQQFTFPDSGAEKFEFGTVTQNGNLYSEQQHPLYDHMDRWDERNEQLLQRPWEKVAPAYSTRYRPSTTPLTPYDGGETPPYGRQTAPYGRETAPYGRETAPYGRETAPYGRETAPYGRETAPYGRETAPYGRETAPYGRETAPYGRDTRTYTRDRVPYTSYGPSLQQKAQYPATSESSSSSALSSRWDSYF